MDSLYGTPVTGLRGADFEMNVIANNIANVNTTGYQEVEASMADLPTQAQVGDQNNGDTVPVSTHVGMGVKSDGTRRGTAQAVLESTGNAMDLAISGPEYFTVRQPDGTRGYTQQMTLVVQPNGQLTTTQGLAVVPPMRVPAGATHVTVDASGRVSALLGKGKTAQLGRLQTVDFTAPENLSEQNGIYSETLGSGRPRTQSLPQEGGNQVMSGYQLHSTVDLATEMATMIDAQRMYQANAKALQTLDALVNNVVSIQPR